MLWLWGQVLAHLATGQHSLNSQHAQGVLCRSAHGHACQLRLYAATAAAQALAAWCSTPACQRIPAAAENSRGLEPSLPQPAGSACGATLIPARPQSPQWFPVNILKGGKQMDAVIVQLQTGWGKALYQKFLIRQVATSLYKCAPRSSDGPGCRVQPAGARSE